MKIKKIKQYNLINYNLLKSRSYLGLQKLSFFYLNSSYIIGFRHNFSLFNLRQTKNFIKKLLLIIYKFHYNNKKILFIGFPNNITTNKSYDFLFRVTNHDFISYDNWINNFFTNYKQILSLKKKLFFKKIINNKELKTLINIKHIPDLIVVYNQTRETKLVQEILSNKIPFISFMNSSSNLYKLEYKVLGGFHNLKTKIFIYLLLKSILTLPKMFDNISLSKI
jgi:ribosomal protein S2